MRENVKKIKNFKKPFLVICLVIVSIFLLTLFTDLNRVKNNKPPMFALFTVEEKGAKEYIGFGYRVYHQNNSFYAVTFLWADQDDLAVGDPFENKLKVIFSGNLT